jgi:hypothetical protein
MSEFHSKYLKYKNKYLKLKQIGGAVNEKLVGLILVGDLPIETLFDSIREVAPPVELHQLLNRQYTFAWNSVMGDHHPLFTNRIFDAIVNYNFINTAGVNVIYQDNYLEGSKGRQVMAGEYPNYEEILNNIFHYFIANGVNLRQLLITRGNEYPFNPLFSYSIFSLFSNNYFNIIYELLIGGIIEPDLSYLYVMVCKKIFCKYQPDVERLIDGILTFLLERRGVPKRFPDDIVEPITNFEKILDRNNPIYTYNKSIFDKWRAGGGSVNVSEFIFFRDIYIERQVYGIQLGRNYPNYMTNYSNIVKDLQNTPDDCAILLANLAKFRAML